MAQALESVLPLFAPLPGPIVLHLLLGERRRHRKAPPPPLVSEFERETRYSQAEWDRLLKEIRTVRQDVFLRLDPLVRRDAVTTAWLLQALAQATPQKVGEDSDEERETINQSTLKYWKDRGLISYSRRNRPYVQQAAALLIARLVDRRVRNWLPTGMNTDEACMWCWRQDAPGRAAVPSPFPLPEDLPKAALLVSTWPGMVWDPHWQRIDSVGAARWFGATVQERWDITLEELRQWDPQAAALLPPVEGAPDILQMLADVALIRLAFTQLSAQL